MKLIVKVIKKTEKISLQKLVAANKFYGKMSHCRKFYNDDPDRNFPIDFVTVSYIRMFLVPSAFQSPFVRRTQYIG